MLAATFLLVVIGSQAASGLQIAPIVAYFASRDLCEAGAIQLRRDLSLTDATKHSCVPLIGSALR